MATHLKWYKHDGKKTWNANSVQVETDDMVLFWHTPSVFTQWFQSSFVVDGEEFCCTEQWMMSEKARLFNDLETREEIMKTKDPKKHKQLGRLVRNFDKMIWNRKSYEIVLIGNRAKFTQNEQLKEILVATGKKQIAEASPMDRIWGIGLAPDNPLALDSKKWRGKNMLGTILMQVRSELQQQDEKD